jgi:hypothetical protein
MFVIAQGAGNASTASFYQVEWQIIPNLAMDLIVPPLARFVNVYTAGQLFLTLTFLLISTGTMALHRVLFGKWSVLPLLALPVMYNHILLVGTVNYIFGIGVALWAMAAWVYVADRPLAVRVAVGCALNVALFFSHLFVVGVFGIAALAYELSRIGARPSLRPVLARFAALALTLIPTVVLLALSPTAGLAKDISWEPLGKLDGLIFAITEYYDVVAFLLVAVVLVGAIVASRHRLLATSGMLLPLVLLSGVTYLVLPRILFATYMADQRLPIAILFFVIACFDIDMRSHAVRRVVVAVLLFTVALRVCEVSVVWSDLSFGTAEFKSSLRRIKPGSKVLVAYSDSSAGDDPRDLGLVHAACMAIIERSALVTTAFTVKGKQILSVRPEVHDIVDTEDGNPPTIGDLMTALSNPDGAEDRYWQEWATTYDYVYVLFTEDEAANPAPDHLRLVHDGDRYQLYKVLPAGGATAPHAKKETQPAPTVTR